MGKISIYFQDDKHTEKFYEFFRSRQLVLDAYINSEEYQEAVEEGAEHIHSNTVLIGSEEDNYHIEIIIKNGSSCDYNFPKGKRES